MDTKEKTSKRWWGFYSRTAELQNCPIYTYLDKYGNELKVTGVSPDRSGLGYIWSDKALVCELTGLKSVRTTYIPHRDYHTKYWFNPYSY